MQEVQHPLIAVVQTHEQPSPFEREGQAMLAAACELRRIALSLPEPSSTREQMLASAQHWATGAQLRGVTQPRLRSA